MGTGGARGALTLVARRPRPCVAKGDLDVTVARCGRAALMAVALLIADVTVSSAADPRQLQFTGTVTAIDAKARTITVRNGDDTRVLATDGLNVPKLKKGDKVSIDYRVVAWKIKRR
jgi:Cu/Ag efflux protein CusF